MSTLLDAQLRVERGDFALEAEIQLAAGEVLALLGPNGSGKSTLLETLAGLLVPDSGTVTVLGKRLTGWENGALVSVPPERRKIGLLGQDPLLFPHLSAEENVAFGQKAQGAPRRIALSEARGWLDAVGLAGFATRKPAQLSGGQQQRLAIARALAAQPSVLLLDEPMAALDVQTAVAMRKLLRDQLARTATPAIIVTHDVLDAIVLADRVAILHEGRIIDEGPTARVLGLPRNSFIAALAGLNLVHGTALEARAGGGDRSDGIRLLDGRMLRGRAGGSGRVAAGPASAVFAPAAVTVSLTEPTADVELNRWSSIIAALEPSSGGIRVRLADDAGVAAELTASRVAELGLQAGTAVWLSVRACDITIYADLAI